MSTFSNEADFENALCDMLHRKGWKDGVLLYPTEDELLRNWAQILFDNNKQIDRLNGCPLTQGEMSQLMEQIVALRTPVLLNGFINGKTVTIRRDNQDDTLHFGKEVSLKIYDRMEIAEGESRYQIARQPRFARHRKVLPDRRGDMMLLINGMPVFHIELKRSGVDVSQACHQIEKYSHEGIFNGLFSLVQIFVAMTPERTLYFANPGPDGKFNPDFYFHWADFNNVPIHEWERIAESLLSIPMAHQMLGFYTVADSSDGILKVMRSYQYYAAHKISDRVKTHHWGEDRRLGGYVWHTTGSGKTMTSFKSAQLIAGSKHADKVVFLMDRIELGTQSLEEYRAFADDSEEVQGTEDTHALISKLKSKSPAERLIVTSIQKMSRIKGDGVKTADLDKIRSRRLVFVVDEAHRSTFGDMLQDIRDTFPHAMLFGFTGTPIHDENRRKLSTTTDVFGGELHRYSIADGIRDKNVLGFDPHKVMTYRDNDLRYAVALARAKAKSEEDALADARKRKVFYHYMDEVPMVSFINDKGKRKRGIEDYADVMYKTPEHREIVVEHICRNWQRLSRGGKFHAMLAASTIPEAVEYYHLFRKKAPWLRTTALFDPNIDNEGDEAIDKEEALAVILEDYNNLYGKNYSISTHAQFKRDLSYRLAHKKAYERVEFKPELQLNLLIVVDQMLTGFDSKWVNTLYLDKVLRYESIIQAFSRTNRLFGPEKPFGTIYYYRKPHTMEKNVEAAVKLYSGDKPLGLYAEKLPRNLEMLNAIYTQIQSLFDGSGVNNFERLPEANAERAKFAQLFNDLNEYLEAAKVQGFRWDWLHYEFEQAPSVDVLFDENIYLVLALRYKELFNSVGLEKGEAIPYAIEPYLTEIDTGRINSDYMNSRFEKYLKVLNNHEVDDSVIKLLLEELHQSFSALSQEEQKYADIFLRDVANGDVLIQSDKTFRDYVSAYIQRAENDRIHRFSELLGLNEKMLRNILDDRPTAENLDKYSRFEKLKETVNKEKAKAYFENKEQKTLPAFRIGQRVDELLRIFVLSGGERPALGYDDNEEKVLFAADEFE